MSASRDVCREQVLLFRNYHGFPLDFRNSSEDKTQLKALIDTFERWCVSDDHARATGLKLLESVQFCPKPVDIKAVAESFGGQFATRVIGVACGNACSGSGFIVEGNNARKCICHPGRQQAAFQAPPKHPQSPMPMKHIGEIAGKL